MSQIFGLLFLSVFLLLVCMPAWFAGRLVLLFFSQAQRDKFRAHWLLYSIWGVASFLVIAVAWVSYAPKHLYYSSSEPFVNAPLTRDSIAQADAIVEGSFDPDHVISTSGETLLFPYGASFQVNCFVVPFKVEGSAKGDPGKCIPVKIFFPTANRGAMQWGLPMREKLLLLLKEDPLQAGTFELMSQQASWLVIVRPHAADAAKAEPNKFVLDDAREFLQACVDHPEVPRAIAYSTDIPCFFSTPFGVVIASFPESDPAREHALQMGRLLAGGDPAFSALAPKFQGEYGQVGTIASSICANSGDISYLESRLKAYNREPPGTDAPSRKFAIIGNNHFNFPWQVANTIRDSDDPGKLMLLISEALASPDPRMRLMVAQALREHQSKGNEQSEHGNRLGNQFYPILVKLLDDPDWEVQYAAMGCMFEMSGSIKQPFGHRDLELWATPIVKKDPNFYTAQYKEWWEKHKAELGP